MSEQAGTPAKGVVVHVDEGDPGKQEAAIRNISNLLDALDDGTVVELVAHGPGLSAVLRDGPHADKLSRLLDRGVQVAACSNTMESKEISTDQLVQGTRVVPAGIAELVLRQRDGWAYVRP